MVFAGTFAIFAVYLVNFIMMFLEPQLASYMIMGFLVLAFIIGGLYCSIKSVLDFDYIEQGAEQGAPKYLEWYGAFFNGDINLALS